MKEQSQIAYAGREARAEAVGAEPRGVSQCYASGQEAYGAVRRVPVNLKLSCQTVISYVPRKPTVERVVE